MHDIHDITDQECQEVIPWLRDEGYLCVTVEELFWRYGLEPARYCPRKALNP